MSAHLHIGNHGNQIRHTTNAINMGEGRASKHIIGLCLGMWSAVAQLVECRTRNRESPGSNPRCYRFEVWAFPFTSRRLSRFSCINEYLAIDSGGNVSE